MRAMFHDYISRITALTCRPVNYELRNNAKYYSTWTKKFKTPVKVIMPDELCRVCRCRPAILSRGKFNLFSAQSKALKLADWVQTVLGQPVHSSSVCSDTPRRWRTRRPLASRVARAGIEGEEVGERRNPPSPSSSLFYLLNDRNKG